MRRPFIAGNWKMYKTAAEAVNFVQKLEDLVEDAEDVDVVICPPFTALKSVSTVMEYDKPNFSLGAQNMHWEEEGAFTGEVSPLMLRQLLVDYVILGHSERREHFDESDQMINKKVKAALSHDLNPILCVGESFSEREKGKTQEKVKTQLEADLEGFSSEQLEKAIIAYEPIWAIGTGVNATPEEANDVIRYIRAFLASSYNPELAQKVRVIYGGSVKPKNVSELMAEPEMDGALVGGASLDPESFAQIVNYQKVSQYGK